MNVKTHRLEIVRSKDSKNGAYYHTSASLLRMRSLKEKVRTKFARTAAPGGGSSSLAVRGGDGGEIC
jgi:hypothetical protein